MQMETDEQLSNESDSKDKSSVEKEKEKEKEEDNKSQEEEVKSAPAVKHLEENELFSEYYLVDIMSCYCHS